MEQWKFVSFYDYRISSKGRLKNRGKIIKGSKDKDGYVVHNLYYRKIIKSIKFHRLVAQLFIPNPENKPQVNHKNGIKDDNRIENLEWVTGSENMKHSFSDLNRKNISKKIIQSTLDGIFLKEWESTMEIERKEGFSHSYISAVCLGKYNMAYGYLWKHK